MSMEKEQRFFMTIKNNQATTNFHLGNDNASV